MSFANYETTYETINGVYTCVYCGNTNLVIDDSFDEYGNYQGTRYYCTCEQAKIEQQMKSEMELVEKKKQEIENKYKDKLKYNKKAIAKAKLEEEISETLKKYVMYGDLRGMSKSKFLELVDEIFDREVWYDDYLNGEDDDY
jgi:hypothetical protein